MVKRVKLRNVARSKVTTLHGADKGGELWHVGVARDSENAYISLVRVCAPKKSAFMSDRMWTKIGRMQSRSDPAKLAVRSISVVFLSYVVFHVKCFVSFLKWAAHDARWPAYQHDPQGAS